MGRTFIVLNPAAESYEPQALLDALHRHLGENGSGHELYPVTAPERVAAAIRAALGRGSDSVSVAGGDGTVSAVAAGLSDADVPIGITLRILGWKTRILRARSWVVTNGAVIRTDPPLPVQADGDCIGRTPLEVSLVPNAFQVVVASPAAG